jgi:hypothetical protein
MGMQGTHAALTNEQFAQFSALADDASKFSFLFEFTQSEPTWTNNSDKSWEALLRCFREVDSLPEAFEVERTDPLAQVFFGGRSVSGEFDYGPIYMLEAEEVITIAGALQRIDREWLVCRFERYGHGSYAMGQGEDDVEYLWHWLGECSRFFRRAADERRYVLFLLW